MALPNNYIVIDTLAATGGDAVLSNSYLYMNNGTSGQNAKVCQYLDIIPESFKATPYNAGTAGTVAIPFPTSAAGDAYTIKITSQNSATGEIDVTTIRYTFTGVLSATLSGDAIVAATPSSTASVNPARVTAANSSGTVTWTAVAGWEQIIQAVIVTKPATSTLAVVTLSVGTAAVGTAAQLTALGLTYTGTTYDRYQFTYTNPNTFVGNGGQANATKQTNVYFVNSAASTNYTNLTNRLAYIFTSNTTYTAIPTELYAVS